MSLLGFLFGTRAATAKDPVCGMPVETLKAKWSSSFEERDFYFCSQGCKRSFDDDPSLYVKIRGGSGAAAPPREE